MSGHAGVKITRTENSFFMHDLGAWGTGLDCPSRSCNFKSDMKGTDACFKMAYWYAMMVNKVCKMVY